MDAPKTLLEAVTYFSDFDRCRDFMIALRWPDGVRCPECGSERVSWLATARRWKCSEKHPRRQFSLKTGTIFADSPLPLSKWLPALWLIVNAKNGVSSCEIARALGVTQKTAWFMGHRIRAALHAGSFDKMTWEVEVDETFIGGKARNMHTAQRKRRIHGRGTVDKTVVLGFLKRGGEVRATVVDDRKKATLHGEVQKHVAAGSALYTDELVSYQGLDAMYAHGVINHAVQYVDENVHTNGMENFWSLLKRGLHGTYVSVEPFHLFRYLDEQAYRFNERFGTDLDRFRRALARVTGRRVTYDHLTGKDHEPELIDLPHRGPSPRGSRPRVSDSPTGPLEAHP